MKNFSPVYQPANFIFIKRLNYQVVITQTGRGGIIYYLEKDKQLPIDWEVATSGALLFVKSPKHWNNFCDSHDLPEARNRREEILEKVSREVIRQQASGADYEIGDDFISISF